jgi:hypothetical protein
MTREDLIDLTFLAIAASAITAIYLLARDYLKPLPIHKRAWVQIRKAVGR